jgi:hypothetical protein
VHNAPVKCLEAFGLQRAHQNKGGWWEANLGHTSDRMANDMVFIEGPYKNDANANEAAASLKGVEIAQRGGLYVVEATLRGHLGSLVPQIAGCLSRTTSNRPDQAGFTF